MNANPAISSPISRGMPRTAILPQISFWILTLPFLWLYYSIQSISVVPNQLPPEIAGLIMIWIPVLYLLFSAAHTILEHFSTVRAPAFDRASYFLLILFLILSILFSRLSMMQPLTSVLYLSLLGIKAFFLLQHLVHSLRRPGKPGCRRWPVFLLFVAIFIGLSGYAMNTTRLQGDEPFFLLIVQSLIQDHDFFLENNYLQSDSLKFTDVSLTPQLWDNYRQGHLVSRHSLLLPFILIPGYLIASKTGAILTISLISSLSGLVLFMILSRLTGSIRAALTASIMLMVTAPLVIYSNKLYTEMLAALFGLIVFAACLRIERGKKMPLLLAGLATFLAAWLKTRFIVLCLPMILVAVLRRKSYKFRIYCGLFLCLMLALLAIINLFFYDSVFGRYEIGDLANATLYRVARGSLGLFWDAQYGIVPLNWFVLLSGAGFLVMIRRWRSSGIFLWLSAFIPYFLIVVSYAELIGGFCPRGRFSVAWLPFLAVPIAFYIKRCRNLLCRIWFWITGIAGLTVSFLLNANPRWQIDLPGRHDFLIETLTRVLSKDVLGLLPSFDRVDYWAWRDGIVLTAMWIAGSLLIYLASRIRSPGDRGSIVPGAAVLGLLGSAILMLSMNKYLRTPWMEAEDPTFESKGASIFWEEPYKWDRKFSLQHPYRSGIEIKDGEYLKRTYKIRGKGSFLECVAKGNAANSTAPILQLDWAGKPVARTRIRSDEFQSYFVALKDIDPNSGNPEFHLQKVEQSGDASVIIDKIRLVDVAPSEYRISEDAGGPEKLFPIEYPGVTIKSFEIEEKEAKQNQPLHVIMEINLQPEAVALDAVLRLRQRYTFYDHAMKWDSKGKLKIEITPPFSLGSGIFNIELRVGRENQVFEPGGAFSFSYGDSAYLGDVDLIPVPAPIDPDDQRLMETVSQQSLLLLPYSIHLGTRSSLLIPIDPERSASSVLLMSNLTNVLDAIPYLEAIGELRIHSVSHGWQDHPLLIGEHTAEDMYEFPSKRVRLSHPEPPVIKRTNVTLEWPPPLKGIRFSSLTFISEIPVSREDDFDQLEIRFDSPFGTFHIDAIALKGSS
jgi:hypothetical protein